MTHISMKMIGNNIKIKINNKINNLTKLEILEIYCIIYIIKQEEVNIGNDFEKAFLKIKILKETQITEYINIYSLVREPIFYEFLKYFKNFKNKFNEQNLDTKLNINDYFSEIENISQEIILTLIFKPQITIKIIEEKQKKLFNKILTFEDLYKTIA